MRKIIIILVCLTVLLLLGFSGYRAYQLWNQSHWMSMAKNYAAKNDGANERLALEHVLRLNKRNVEACRMFADLAEATGSKSALALRKQVLDLNPDSLNDRLALARTALHVSDYATATNALAGVDAADRKTVAYLNIAGELAFSFNRLNEAEADFAEATRIDPSKLGPQLSLAAIELSSTNSLDADEARITLERISLNSTNAEARLEAKRDLIFDAVSRKDFSAAQSLSQALVGLPDATFADKLLRLDVLKITGSDEFQSVLASTQREAATNNEDMAHLALWMLERRMPAQTLAWLQSLPASAQTNPTTAQLIAECQIIVQDWTGLQKFLSKQNWDQVDFKRQAFLALALRKQGLSEASQAQWDVALKSANGRDSNLTTLFQFAVQWGWQDDAQQILWTIVNNFPQEQWAVRQLATGLYATGSTRPLMELFSLQVNRTPGDLEAKNDLAMIAMLLNARELNPYALAKEVYQKSPTNSFFACTYAFSLYLQGKNADALKIMQQLTPKALSDSSTGGYYGLILKANGDNTQAGPYLKRAIRAKLLPEERALFQQALSGF